MTGRRSSLLFAGFPLRLSACAAAVFFCAAADAGEDRIFSFTADTAMESAYISRGVVWDKRPYNSGYVEGEIGLPEFGRISAYAWTMSATTSKGTSSDMTRYAYNEIDWCARYFYDWSFADKWTLSSGVGHQWIVNPGFRDGHSSGDWQFIQSLDNPYLVPHWRARVIHHPFNAFYVQAGVKRSFNLAENLDFTVDFFGDFGDNSNFRSVYGRRPDKPHGRYHGGLQALNLVFRLDYKLMEHVGVYAFLGQFGVVSDDARAAIKASDAREAVRDLTFGGVGVHFDF